MTNKLAKTTTKTLDSIPQKIDPPKKSKIPKLEVPKPVRDAVDSFVKESRVEKEAKKVMDSSKETILFHMEKVLKKDGEEGQYTKSFRIIGNEEEVTYTKPAKYSIKADIERLKKVAGSRFVENNFTQKIVLAVNPAVLEDKLKLTRLLKRLKDSFGSELGEYFVQERTLQAKPDLDKNFFELPEDKRRALKDLVVQAQAGLKV